MTDVEQEKPQKQIIESNYNVDVDLDNKIDGDRPLVDTKPAAVVYES